jgi:CDP-diacylglycerol--serine O-phosphatidyltransferase
VPPIRYLAPNAVTALSLLFGLGSIAMSVEGSFHLAAWLILWGVLLDKLDGGVARLLKATSPFGVEFDSFADFVVFGMAPAALIYYRMLATGHFFGWSKPLLMAAAGAYCLALAVRLARFNVTTDSGDTVFVGFPGTLLGAIIGSAFLTWEKHGAAEWMLKYSPVVLVAGALLMVSTVRLPKVKPRKNKLLNAFQLGNLAAAYIFAPLMLFPEYLFGISLLYATVGAVWCALHPVQPALAVAAVAPAVAAAAAPDSETSDEDETSDEPSEELA